MIIYKNDYTRGIVDIIDFDNLNWQSVEGTPRKECFLAPEKGLEYSYDGSEHVYVSEKMSGVVEKLLNNINGDYNTDYNVCFLNRYEDEKNHLGWHSDDSVGMDLSHPIAVLSYGAERYIYWKAKGQKGELPDFQKVYLKNDSLFIMPEHFQRFFLHKIPKHNRPCGPRVSLTFRKYNY